jgi:tripartite ATP-independent transporter DctM subunit
MSFIPLSWMAPLMFAGLVLFMVIGFPVTFSLAAVGLFFGFLAIEHGYFDFALMQALPERVFGIVSNDTLLAIPFFTLMGAILERCGLAEDLLDGLGQLFGPVRGGLAYAVVIVGAILGAITGTVAASVIAMGLISLPVMMRYGYNMRFATGVIAASGTITQLIPPSLVLIVLADVLGRSVGDMYAGAWGPSLVQVLLFCAFVFAVSIFKPEWAPGIPLASRTLHGWPLVKKCLWGIVPSLVLIFLVLGTIYMGLATPTEAGAMGTVGAIGLAVVHHAEFSRYARIAGWVAAAAISVICVLALAAQPLFQQVRAPLFMLFYAGLAVVLAEAIRITALRKLIWQASQSTMRITAMVLFILIGSTIFVLVFRGVDGDPFIEHLGIDLIWFGVLLCVNMQTSFMHPPFGFALFYLRSIAPKEIRSSEIYWGAIPWVVLQVIMVGIVIAFPQLVTAFLDKGNNVDPSTVNIEIQREERTGDEAPPDFGQQK